MNNPLTTSIPTSSSMSTEKLVQNVKDFVSDAEALLAVGASQSDEAMTQLHASMSVKLANVKDRLMTMEQTLVRNTKAAARATDQYVHASPWQSMAIAASVGYLISRLMVSRGD